MIKRRKWNWIGHTVRRPASDIAKTALDWNPQVTRKITLNGTVWMLCKKLLAKISKMLSSSGPIKLGLWIYTLQKFVMRPFLSIPTGRSIYYVDGGLLLHRVVWQPAATYADIYSQYEKYLSSHYGRGTHIIFDGYSNRLSTKDQEQNHHLVQMFCLKIIWNIMFLRQD